MVCHETYRDKNGDWLYPDEIKKFENKKAKKIKDDSEVIIGPPESMSKSKKYNRSRGNDKYLWC